MLTKNKRLFHFDSCLTLQNSFFFPFDIVFLLYRFRLFSFYFVFLLYRLRRFFSMDFVFLHYRFRFMSLDFVFLLYRFRWILLPFRFVSFLFVSQFTSTLSFYIFTFLMFRKLNKPQLTKIKQQHFIVIRAFDSRLYLDILGSFKWKESFIFR